MKSSFALRFITYALIGMPVLFIIFKIGYNGANAIEETTSAYEVELYSEDDITSLAHNITAYNKDVQLKADTNSGNRDSSGFRFQVVATPVNRVYTIDPAVEYQPSKLPYLKNFLGEDALYPLSEIDLEKPVEGTSMVQVLDTYFELAKGAGYEQLSTFGSALNDTLAYSDENLLRNAYFATLCRKAGIPARVHGGISAAPETTTGALYWTEVRVANFWIPYYPVSDAEPVASGSILTLATTPEEVKQLISFDERLKYRLLSPEPDGDITSLLDAPGLASLTGLPISKLMLLLMLPIAALVVSILKNIVGVKTFGIFLPALIALTLLETGFLAGVLLFTAMVMAVACVYRPLSHWGIQHNSKIALMLTIVVLAALVAVRLLAATTWLDAATPLFFPIVILTIVSERFAVKAEEENLKSALRLYASTMMVTTLVYAIIAAPLIQQFVLNHPEIILTVAGVKLLLGRWTGIRVTEYYRFYNLAK